MTAAVRSFVVRTYGWMLCGLVLSAGVAAWLAAGNAGAYFEDHPLVFVALLVATIGLMAAIGLGVDRLSAQVAAFLYFLFVAINGVVLSVVFDAYTSAEIAPAFLAAAGMFGVAALYGYRTERDLGDLRSFVFIGFWGFFFAFWLNLVFASSALYWLVTFAGVALFLAMTMITSQKLAELGAQRSGVEAENLAVFGALLLYLELCSTSSSTCSASAGGDRGARTASSRGRPCRPRGSCRRRGGICRRIC